MFGKLPPGSIGNYLVLMILPQSEIKVWAGNIERLLKRQVVQSQKKLYKGSPKNHYAIFLTSSPIS